jgi:hypothetical protein
MTTEHQEYEAFVDKTVKQLRSSLKIDHTSKKRKVASLLESHVINTNESAAERVIRSRFLLGHDDDAYLRTGLSTLWSTAPDDDTGLELSPPGLYTPDAVDGIRSGLVSALKRKNRAMERNAPANLAALVPALKLLVTLPTVANALAPTNAKQAALREVLKHNWSEAASQDPKTLGPLRTQLLEFLGKLHAWLSSARKDDGTQPGLAQLVLEAVKKQAQEHKKTEAAHAKEMQKAQRIKAELDKLKAKLGQKDDELQATLADAKKCADDLDSAKAVDTLKAKLEKDAATAQKKQEAEAEVNTADGQLFAEILKREFATNPSSSTSAAIEAARKKALAHAQTFARLALVGMGKRAISNDDHKASWSMPKWVARSVTERAKADARFDMDSTTQACTRMTANWAAAKSGANTVGKAEYTLLCRNMVAWGMLQTGENNVRQIVEVRDIETFIYFIPLVNAVADNLRNPLADTITMQSVNDVLLEWYSLPQSYKWKLASEDGLWYLYTEADGEETESATRLRSLMAKALQLATGLGVADAALVTHARAYFGGAFGTPSAATDNSTAYDEFAFFKEHMDTTHNGVEGLLIPGLRAIGTSVVNATLAFTSYAIATIDDQIKRLKDMFKVAQVASSPITTYTFNRQALEQLAKTDPSMKELLKLVVPVEVNDPLVAYDNQSGRAYADAPHDCVLFEVGLPTLPMFSTNFVVQLADFRNGLAPGIAEKLGPQFLNAMGKLTGLTLPSATTTIEANDACSVALVIGTMVRLDVPNRAQLITDATIAHTMEARRAKQQTIVRSRMQHVTRRPQDNAPPSVKQTLDWFVDDVRNETNTSVVYTTRVYLDYLVVPLEDVLEKTQGYTVDGGMRPRVDNLLVTPSLMRLRDDPLTGTLSVEEVTKVLRTPRIEGSSGSVPLNDLPIRVLASPVFYDIEVDDKQFAELQSYAAEQLVSVNSNAGPSLQTVADLKAYADADRLLYKFKQQCEQNQRSDEVCQEEWAKGYVMVKSLSSVARKAMNVTATVVLAAAGLAPAFAIDTHSELGNIIDGVNIGSTTDDDNDLAHWVVARGIVGQRGPVCTAVKAPGGTDKDIKLIDREADAAIAMVDAQLAYALPSPVALGRLMPHLKPLLDATSDPTAAEVNAALATLSVAATKATSAEVIAAFDGNYAVVGPTAAAADDDRGGIEVPHAVRWLPTADAAGRSAARAAALEHVAARCTQLAEAPDASEGVKAALREAAATLKLAQMAPLYATREAVAYGERDDCCAPPPVTDDKMTLVTRPCAIVRGTLAMPVNAGVAHVDSEQRIKGDTQLDDANNAKQALEEYMSATRSVRAQARAQGLDPSVYVAPPLKDLRFQRASAAATGVAPASAVEVAERCSPDDFTAANWLRIVNRAIVAANSLRVETGQQNAANRVDGMLTALQGEGVTAESRRDGLWNEFRRKLGISGDRLWDFVRLMSGAVGGDVNELITMADEATMRATKAIQEERLAIAKRVSDMQAKIVETIVGSMAKESKLAFENDGNQFVVIDAEAKKRLKDLQSGQLGVPFFEANVAMRNLQNDDENAEKTTLSQLLSGLSQVGKQLQESLEQTLTRPGPVSASLADLSHPANCYFVSLRPDAVAAIRIAHERMNVELGLRGAGRRLSLYEVVEGGCSMLTTRFAEFSGHVLVQARSTTGISAMYVAPQAMHTNAIQARIALERLVHGAGLYGAYVNSPNWDKLTDQTADVQQERDRLMDAGSQVQEHTVGRVIRQAMRGPAAPAERFLNRGQWRVMNLPSR